MSTPPPAILGSLQLFLVVVGIITAGAAVSMRADLWWSWALFGLAGLLGSVGLPDSWDSFPMVFRVLAAVGAAGAVLCLLPRGWRVGIISAGVLFHFSGIFAATTSPPPQPWIVEQAWTRVYHPYLNFVYLRNAYHFYSPNPGPSSVLVFFLKTETGTDETGKPKYETKWVVMPTRPGDIRDPLGLGYFRRLSITEQVARGGNNLAGRSETAEVLARRMNMAPIIPIHPLYPAEAQYRLPDSNVIRYVLPSYASHIILEETPDSATAAKTTVKIYRLEHMTLPADQFQRKLEDGSTQNPYHAGTFRPYFMGEFDVHGNLLNPQEPLLYWMVPIIPLAPRPGSVDNKKTQFYDYMSVHALEADLKDVYAADEDTGWVFPWKKLDHRR
ncbi:MAG: hypothetical protein U0792_17390 [Gemmataceae bacterium]